MKKSTKDTIWSILAFSGICSLIAYLMHGCATSAESIKTVLGAEISVIAEIPGQCDIYKIKTSKATIYTADGACDSLVVIENK